MIWIFSLILMVLAAGFAALYKKFSEYKNWYFDLQAQFAQNCLLLEESQKNSLQWAENYDKVINQLNEAARTYEINYKNLYQNYQNQLVKNQDWAGKYSELSKNSEEQRENITVLYEKLREFSEKRDSEIKSARLDANTTARQVIKGKVSEELSPFLPEFPYLASDLKLLLSPVDFVVFSGMSADEITEIIFLEIKTNKSPLSPRQKQIQNCLKNGKIRWDTFHIE